MLGATPMPHPDTSHRLQLRGCPHPAGVMSDPGLPFFEQSSRRQIIAIISRSNRPANAIRRHDEHWHGGGGIGSFMSGSTRNKGEMKPGHYWTCHSGMHGGEVDGVSLLILQDDNGRLSIDNTILASSSLPADGPPGLNNAPALIRR